MEQHDTGTGGWTFGCVGVGVRGRCFLGWVGDVFNFSLEMCLGLEVELGWGGLDWVGTGGCTSKKLVQENISSQARN